MLALEEGVAGGGGGRAFGLEEAAGAGPYLPGAGECNCKEGWSRADVAAHGGPRTQCAVC